MVIDHYVDNYFIIDNTGEESEKQKIRIYDMQTKELDETIDNVQDYDYLDNMIFYSTNNKLMAFNILTKETTEYYDLSKIPFKDYYIFAYSIDTVLIVEEKAELYEDADEIDDEEIDDAEIDDDDDESEDEEEPDEKDNQIIIYKKTEVPEIPKVILYMKDGTTKEIPLEELNDFE